MREGVFGARLPPQAGLQVHEGGGLGGGTEGRVDHLGAHAQQVFQHVEAAAQLGEGGEEQGQ